MDLQRFPTGFLTLQALCWILLVAVGLGSLQARQVSRSPRRVLWTLAGLAGLPAAALYLVDFALGLTMLAWPSHLARTRPPALPTRGGFGPALFDEVQSPARVRVLCLGDSATYGWGVDPRDTFPSLLQEALQRRFPERPVRVLNAGVPGAISAQGVRLWKRMGRDWRPHVVILAYGHNDAMTVVEPRTGMPTHLPPRSPHLERWRPWHLSSLCLALRLDGEMRWPFSRTLQWISPQGFGENLREVVEEARAGGSQVLLLNPMGIPGIYHRVWKGVAAKAGIPAIDYYAEGGARLILSPRDHHPGPEGHREIARRLWERLNLQRLSGSGEV